jgi:glycosyltransferase
MKISIITTCLNSEKTIEDTIKSVLFQNYPDLEYIIIDGGSKDNTLKIINKYKDRITGIISEPDSGIYDAMNKGVKMVTGEVVGIINSDDFFAHDTVIDKVASYFEHHDVGACYGDISYFVKNNTNKQVRFWKAGEYNKKKLKNGWAVPHPAFFVRKEVYEKYGLFNTGFEIAADYELMLRFLLKGVRLGYIKETLVKMRSGGYSANSFNQRIKGWRELREAWRFNNQKTPLFFIIRRLVLKIKQYFV